MVVDRAAGRQRNLDRLAERLHHDLRRPQLRQDPLVEEAMGAQAQRLLATLNTECDSVDQLGHAVTEAFAAHPDHKIITSFTGLGDLTGARVLGEIGDDRSRFRDARGLKSYAGSSPITVASGRSLVVHHRKVENQRLAAAGYVWIFGALPSPQVKQHYDRRRAAGEQLAVVVHDGRFVGVITLSDVLRRVLPRELAADRTAGR